jgi:hypothetical protein
MCRLMLNALMNQPRKKKKKKKRFSAFYGTRRFITVFIRALHWSLS